MKENSTCAHDAYTSVFIFFLYLVFACTLVVSIVFVCVCLCDVYIIIFFGHETKSMCAHILTQTRRNASKIEMEIEKERI